MTDRIAATRRRQAALRERSVVWLSAAVLIVMIGYMFVGDRPFNPDLLAASEISPINRWMWIGLFAASLPVLWLRRQDVVRLVPAIWPILLLYGWFLWTTSWALDPAASTRRAVLTCLTLIVCVAIVVGLRQAARVHLIACIPCIAVIVVDLLSWGAVPGLAMTPLGLQGLHSQKNMLGMYAMYTIIAGGTAAFLPVTAGQRRVLIGGVAAACITLLASRSSTSIGLTFAACVLLYPLVWLLRRRPIIIAVSLLTMALMVVVVMGGYLAWCGLAGADPLAPLAGVTLTQRTDLWAFIIRNIHQRPWGGAGFGSFWAIDPAVQPSLNSGLWFGQGVNIAPEGHDAYLDLAATTGLIGLTLGLYVLLRAIRLAGCAVHAAPRGMALPTAALNLGYCLMVAGHSVTESTLFSANSQLGTLFILAAVGLEWGRLQLLAEAASLPAKRRPMPHPIALWSRPAMPTGPAAPGRK